MKKILIIIVLILAIFQMVAISANLFSDGFESGDLTAWTGAGTSEGDLSVTAVAALHGSWGLNVFIDDTTTKEVYDSTPNDVSRYRFRFYIDPNGLTMADNDNFRIFMTNNNAYSAKIQVRLLYTTAVGYQIYTYHRLDSGTWVKGTNFAITDAPHCIEVDWKASSSDGADDGFMELIIDGASKETFSGLDTDTARIGFVELGFLNNVNTGTSGTFYMDDFASNDDGSVIGMLGNNAIMFGMNF